STAPARESSSPTAARRSPTSSPSCRAKARSRSSAAASGCTAPSSRPRSARARASSPKLPACCARARWAGSPCASPRRAWPARPKRSSCATCGARRPKPSAWLYTRIGDPYSEATPIRPRNRYFSRPSSQRRSHAMRVYYDKDADLARLEGKTVAVLGYGSQGHAHSLNLRDSGVDVVVGLRPSSPTVKKAKDAGLRVLSVPDAVASASVVMMTLPDETIASVFESEIRPNLKSGGSLALAHGFNFHFGCIVPPEGVNTFMVAPKGPGHLVRDAYSKGGGVPCLVAVDRNPSGNTLEVGLAYAKGIG